MRPPSPTAPLLILAGALLSGCAGSRNAGSPAPRFVPDADDVAAVRQAAEDYVLAFYRAEPDRLVRALSPELAKVGYWRSEPDAVYSEPSTMSYERALEVAATWNADGSREDLEWTLSLFEVTDKTAAVKVTAEWGQDYLLLAEEDGQWRIRHVLWQSTPPLPGS